MITQEWLESCTDEQINKGVAWLAIKEWGADSNHKRKSIDYYCSKGLLNSIAGRKVDYCTNPNDAWPIIEDVFSKGVSFAINSGGIMTGNLGAKYGGIKLDIECSPLRAAMIVYILMSVAE